MDAPAAPPAPQAPARRPLVAILIVTIVVMFACACMAMLAAGYYYYMMPGSTVPNVTGMTLEEAEDVLLTVGLRARAVYRPDSEADPGEIISQDREAGSRAVHDDIVTVEIAGEEPGAAPLESEVPDVVGLFVDEAVAEVEGAGFVAVEEWAYGPPEGALGAGEIYDQSPAAGQTAASGSEVTIYTWGESQ